MKSKRLFQARGAAMSLRTLYAEKKLIELSHESKRKLAFQAFESGVSRIGGHDRELKCSNESLRE